MTLGAIADLYMHDRSVRFLLYVGAFALMFPYVTISSVLFGRPAGAVVVECLGIFVGTAVFLLALPGIALKPVFWVGQTTLGRKHEILRLAVKTVGFAGLFGALAATLADSLPVVSAALKLTFPVACFAGGIAASGWLIHRGITNTNTLVAVFLCAAGLILIYEDFLLGRTILGALPL